MNSVPKEVEGVRVWKARSGDPVASEDGCRWAEWSAGMQTLKRDEGGVPEFENVRKEGLQADG